MSTAELDCVTSVCTLRDLDTWRLVSTQVPMRIAAKRYRVIVPDDQVAKFSGETPQPFEVWSEKHFVGDLHAGLLNRIPAHNRHRTGWYLQQFVKLASLVDSATNETHLIWDSDTLPLKSLQFISDSGGLIFYKGYERHPCYFPPIKRLLGIDNKLPFSFIAQCLPCKTDWAHAFSAAIEQRAGKPWMQAILGAIDLSEVSGFSEYETLGSFIKAHYPEQIEIVSTPWFRFGGTLIGTPQNLTRMPYRLLLKRYDFISIESWDQDLRVPRFLNFMNAVRKELMTKGRL